MAAWQWTAVVALRCLCLGAAEEAGKGDNDDDRVLLYQLRVQDDPAPIFAQSGRGQEGEHDGLFYAAKKFTADSVNVTFHLAAGKTIDIMVNCSEFSVFIDGHGNSLDSIDKGKLQTLVARLPQSVDPVFPKIKRNPDDRLQRADSCDASAALRQSAIFMGEVPTNFQITARHTRYDILCLRSAESGYAKWSDVIGNHKCKMVVGAKLTSKMPTQGDYSCMGRCGAGCKLSWRRQIYTQACLDHDMCSWHNRARGGPMDPNCGDEWMAASDDFMFGDFCAFSFDDDASPIKEMVEIPDDQVLVEQDDPVSTEGVGV